MLDDDVLYLVDVCVNSSLFLIGFFSTLDEPLMFSQGLPVLYIQSQHMLQHLAAAHGLPVFEDCEESVDHLVFLSLVILLLRLLND